MAYKFAQPQGEFKLKVYLTHENPKYEPTIELSKSYFLASLYNESDKVKIIKGQYDSSTEASFSVEIDNRISLIKLHNFAQIAGQESILVRNDNDSMNYLVFVNGENKGKCYVGQGKAMFLEKPTEDHSYDIERNLYYSYSINFEAGLKEFKL